MASGRSIQTPGVSTFVTTPTLQYIDRTWTDHCQPAISRVYVFVVVILNVVSDIYLLSIPIPLLWQVKIDLKRKIPLMALFSGAAFVIAAAIIRAVMITTASLHNDIIMQESLPIPLTPLWHSIVWSRRSRSRCKMGLSRKFRLSGRIPLAHYSTPNPQEFQEDRSFSALQLLWQALRTVISSLQPWSTNLD